MLDAFLGWLGVVFVFIGVFFLFLGALGIFRLPDLFNRLQAGTKATTLGVVSTSIGVGLIAKGWILFAAALAVFLLMTNPISSHAIARASYRVGVKLYPGTDPDSCEERGWKFPEGGDEK
ncbi:monovalent cation/H(+) antiporter subunit G [Mesoaciditoga lauensis]|uniref:monovalent cation/H(+) antiporter subunit G n=1 Tax=Mesoaciditoga lauensis TaxID=1495039 RepID=UPI00055C48C7|nr:monovalent cation/H(+) antiporter subunit G [Mesoaciditoga lauensis]